MDETFPIKQRDTAPAIRYALYPASIVLTGATVRFFMRNRAGEVVVDAEAEVVESTGTPTVEYSWRIGDTAAAGLYEAEFQVTYSDGKIETFPNVGYIKIRMEPDISATTTLPVPVNLVPPAIGGFARVGQLLSATNGFWTNSPSTFAYQWRRGGVAISGATAATYTATGDDVGLPLTVSVTAANAVASGTATSAETSAVLPLAPVNTALPVITGTAQEGRTLTASLGTWDHAPTAFAYQWLSDGSPISGATASAFVLTGAEVGSAITVQVTASNAGGPGAPAVSAATAIIEAADPLLFPFALRTTSAAGEGLNFVKNLRVSLDSGATWVVLGTGAAAALTVARHPDGDKLVVAGWANDAQRDAALFHYEQMPAFPNWERYGTDALMWTVAGRPAPVNPQMPAGMNVVPTGHNAPLGVI